MRGKLSTWQTILACICITAILDGAIVSTKTVLIGPWLLPGGAFIFPLSFAVLAIVERVYGLRASWILAQCSVGVLIATVVVFDVIIALPSPDVARSQAFSTLFYAPLRAVGATIFAFAAGSGAGLMLLTVMRYRHPFRRLFWMRSYIAPTVSQIVTACVGLPLILAGQVPPDQMVAFLINRAVFACMYGIFLMCLIQVAVLVIGEQEDPIPIEDTDQRERVFS